MSAAIAVQAPEGRLGVETFRFPDGQPHVAVRCSTGPATVTARIRNPEELFQLLLVNDILRRQGVREVHLRILYLMGARMDRPMPDSTAKDGSGDIYCHPFTLGVVCDAIRSVRWDSISLFDVHSDVASGILRAKVIHPGREIACAMRAINPEEPRSVLLALPDAGAAKRLDPILPELGRPQVTQCIKHRDMATGQLSGFALTEPDAYRDRQVLIVDDLCDGGWTFTAIGELITAQGPRSVDLYVSHGVFSKGTTLANIGRIFTTDSYFDPEAAPPHFTVFPLS